MKRTYSILIGIGVMILILSLIQISLSNILSTGGIQIAASQEQIIAYQKENAQLEEQIYSLASLTHIAEEAEKMGYVKDHTTAFVLSNPTPLAIKP